MTRIIAGKWRSRRINVPATGTVRPTADRSRETLFSMLHSRLGSFDGLEVLDLFAGSGALAFEALSRGAAVARLVERDQAARRAIEKTAMALAANARLIGSDARHLPPAPASADLVFLDPPYGEGLAPPALRAALGQGWIGPASWIAVETARGEAFEAPEFTIAATRQVGHAGLWLLRLSR